MPTATLAGVDVAVNDEGFFEDPDQWTESMAAEIARGEGIDELTDGTAHLVVFAVAWERECTCSFS